MPKALRNFILTLLALLLLILLTLWLATPPVARHYLEKFFQEQNAEFSAESISLNPLTSRFEIKGMQVTQNGETVLGAELIRVGVRLTDLLDRNIHISELLLDGILLNVSQQGDQLRVAGIDLSAAPETAEQPEEEAGQSESGAKESTPAEAEVAQPESEAVQPESETAEAEPEAAPLAPEAQAEPEVAQSEPEQQEDPALAWGLTLPAAEIRDSRILVNRNGRSDQLEIQSFQINNFSAKGADLQGRISLNSRVNQAPLQISLDLNGSQDRLELLSQISLQGFSTDPLVEFLPPELTGSSAIISLELSSSVLMNGSTLEVTLANTTASVAELKALYAPYRVDSALIQVSLPEFAVTLQDGELARLLGGYRLETGATRLYYQNEQQLLAGWESITTQGGKVESEGALSVQLPEFLISGLTISESRTARDVLPALVKVGQLQLQNLAYSEQDAHLDLDLIAIRQIDTKLVLSDQGEPLNILKVETAGEETQVTTAQASSPSANPEPSSTDAVSSNTTEDVPSEPAVSFRLGRLDISGANSLAVIDRSAKPEVQHILVLEAFHLDKLDTRKPTQASPFELKANAGGYSSIQAEGEIALFTEKPNLKLTKTIREFELPPFSPYISDSLGYDIEAGQLDLDLNLAIVDGMIDGHAKLNLRRTDFVPTRSTSDQAGGAGLIPLNVALGMLKDSKGNIELDVPLSGDTENPSFSVAGFVTRTLGKAILQGASAYAMQAFVPYANVITVAQIAGQQLLKIRFNPLELEPGQVSSPTNGEFIQQFGKLMQERQDLQVKICGYATPADLNLPAGAQELTEDQHKQLQELAGRRASQFKQLVIDSFQIPSARMLTCNAGIDQSKDARPRLEFET